MNIQRKINKLHGYPSAWDHLNEMREIAQSLLDENKLFEAALNEYVKQDRGFSVCFCEHEYTVQDIDGKTKCIRCGPIDSVPDTQEKPDG